MGCGLGGGVVFEQSNFYILVRISRYPTVGVSRYSGWNIKIFLLDILGDPLPTAAAAFGWRREGERARERQPLHLSECPVTF